MASWIALVILAVVLLTAAVTDVRTGKVYNWLVYPAFLFGLAYWTLVGGLRQGLPGAMDGFGGALFAAAAGFVPMLALMSLGAMHGGDVKLMTAVGALAGRWQVVLGTAWYGLWVVCLLALVVMIRKRLVKKTLGRIWGAGLLWLGRNRPAEELGGPPIPVSVGMALGGILAGLEHLVGVTWPWS